MASSSTASASASKASGAAAQGGIIEGLNPIQYSTSTPINLFIVQACIIIIFCRLLHYPFSKLGQPRVIAEVVGGIILGPSVMMRIPGFQEHIFPTASMPVLSNVANLGLILFLFLVGLEVDTRLFKTNWRVALSVGFAGMALPFGLGIAIAWGLYHQFRLESGLAHISFGTYGLFIGTAMSITAFPVLCRILSELQLLGTPVGVTVLAAGIGNDVTGWVLLALCVALVNNSSGLTALYVLLTAIAWVLFLVFAVKPCLAWILRRNGSYQSGPSPSMMALVLLIVLVSAWFTAAIGVHPIFGAFLAGLICPHDGGFNIKLTRKIEDLVSVLLIPLYFALSGLSTNLGLLDDGITWAYVIAVIAIAFFGKLIGGTLAARSCRLLWAESLTIGVLMSCKGLVELIVLNIGLQAGILSQRTFTIFVVMALVTTVATTPLTKLIYPMAYRKKVERWKRGEINWDGTPIMTELQIAQEKMSRALSGGKITNLCVQIRLDTLPDLFSLMNFFGRPRDTAKDELAGPMSAPITNNSGLGNVTPTTVHGLRLFGLTDRTSSIMQSADIAEHTDRDAVCLVFQSFSRLCGVKSYSMLTAVPTTAFADKIVDHAKGVASDLLVIPWSVQGNITEDTSLSASANYSFAGTRFSNHEYLDYAHTVLRSSSCAVGILISPSGARHVRHDGLVLTHTDTGLSVERRQRRESPLQTSQNIVLAFIGGKDDRAALLLAIQLSRNSLVHLTVVEIAVTNDLETESSSAPGEVQYKAGDEPSATDIQLLQAARSADGVDFVKVDGPEWTRKVLDTAQQKLKGADDILLVGRQHISLSDFDVQASTQVSRGFDGVVGNLGQIAATREDRLWSLLVLHAPQSSRAA